MPEVKFVYSHPYERRWFQAQGKKWDFFEGNKDHIKELISVWSKYESKTFETLSKVTGFSWKVEPVKCYLVRWFRGGLSDPLTIGIRKDHQLFIEVLVHELVHILFMQNFDRVSKKWIEKNYGDESLLTKVHIRVNAVLQIAYEEIFDKTVLEKVIERDKQWPDYAKAWEIVEKEGAEEVIKRCIQ